MEDIAILADKNVEISVLLTNNNQSSCDEANYEFSVTSAFLLPQADKVKVSVNPQGSRNFLFKLKSKSELKAGDTISGTVDGSDVMGKLEDISVDFKETIKEAGGC